MTTNNEYYKQIYETLSGQTISEVHTNNYWLKLTCTDCMGYTYTGTVCNGRLIKDMAEYICGDTYTGTHFDNKYLHDMAETLTGEELPIMSDNALLHLIADNINPTPTVRLTTITPTSNNITVGTQMSITAKVLDENRQPIEDASVTFKANGSAIGEDETTDENGEAIKTYTPSVVGSLVLAAEYDVYESASVTKTIVKHTASISIDPISAINVGDTVTVTGTLLIDGVGASGMSVDVYNGSTKLNSSAITTTSGGAFTFTSSATTSSGTMNIQAVYAGDTTHNNANSNIVPVAVTKKTTSTNITTPTLIYMDNFNVVGEILSNGVGVNGVDAVLHWRVNNVEYTSDPVSSVNGAVTFARTAPTSITDYDFWIVFEGNAYYEGSMSSVAQVRVQAETAILAVTSPQNNDTVVGSASINVAGTLKDNDDTALVGKEVTAKIGGTTVGTFTTVSGGAFSGTISGSSLSDGSNNIVFDYDGEPEYVTQSAQTVTVIKSSFTGFSLTEADSKTILSKADGDTATFTVQLKNGSSAAAVSGVPVALYKNSVLWDTINTDATGKVTKQYSSDGVGDITFRADVTINGSVVSESYTVQDCWDYDTLTSNKNKFTLTGSANVSYGSTGLTMAGTANSDSFYTYNVNFPTNFSLECKISGVSGTYTPSLEVKDIQIMGQSGNNALVQQRDVWTQTRASESLSSNDVVKYAVEGNTVKVYLNNTLIQTYTPSVSTYFRIGAYNNRSITITDLKIKPL